MINTDRIIPVTASNLLDIIGIAMQLAGKSATKVSASEVGTFAITSGSGNTLANEALKSADFGASVTSMVLYFIPAYDYEGFSVAGTAVTTSGATVVADGQTLYTATLADSAVTIAKVNL